MDFFQNLFSALDSEDSIAFLFFITCAFLIGFLVAALGWGSRARRRKRELVLLQNNYKDLQVEHERIQEQIDLKQADLIRAEREAEEAMLRAGRLEREKEAMNLEINTLTGENEELRSLNSTYTTNIEALNNQIIGLKTRNTQLSSDVEKEGEAMNQLMDMQSSYQTTVNRLAALETKLETVLDENNALREELEQARSDDASGNFQGLEARMNQLAEENEALRKTLEEAPTSEGGESAKNIEARVEALARENAALKEDFAGVKSGSSTKFLKKLEARIQKLADENANLHRSLEDLQTKSVSLPLADLEARINSVHEENATLRVELETVKSNAAALASAGGKKEGETENGKKPELIHAPTPTIEPPSREDLKIQTEQAQTAIKAAIGTKISKASAKAKDDLTTIKGIGAFIEQKLNGLGIYTFKQISQLDDQMIGQLTTAIEFFPGRIKRDDWVGQATRLLDIQTDQPEALTKSIYPDNAEDLKIIEGIGPKIEKLLKNAGIQNWQDLAKTDVKKLKEILLAAGDRYRIHDPSTWPMQAQLASELKWTELKDYQDYLVGGREVK